MEKEYCEKKTDQGVFFEMNKKKQPANMPKIVNCEWCRFKRREIFSEENRRILYATFWGMINFKRQKDFTLSNVTCGTPERRRQQTVTVFAKIVSSTFSLRIVTSTGFL